MGDYYRRHQLAARIPAKAGTESEYPHLRRPAAQAMAPGWAEALAIPRLAAGVELLGEYQGSGLTKATFLARSPSGQVVHLSRLLYLVLSEIDGQRTVGEIAGRVSATFGRTVSAENVDYLLANKLTPLGLVADEAAADRRDPMMLTLKLRRTLIPAAGVQYIARLFAPLFAPPVVVVLLGSLAAADVWLWRSGQILPSFTDTLAHPPLLLVVLGLSAVSILFHECGHAAACRYGGARPGRIGLGVYVLWPAAFTNVTDSYRLGRAGRIRVDLGGVYFNAIFAVMLAGIYRATGYGPLPAAVLLVHMELVQQLLPSLRCDGYLIMTDLIGVPDMFQRVGPMLTSLIPGRPADPRVRDMRRAARVTLTAWVMVMVPLLGGELVLIDPDHPPAGRHVRPVPGGQRGRRGDGVRPGRGGSRGGERDLGSAAGFPGGRPLLHPGADRAAGRPPGRARHPQAPGAADPADRRGAARSGGPGRLLGRAAAARPPVYPVPACSGRCHVGADPVPARSSGPPTSSGRTGRLGAHPGQRARI